MRNKLFIIKLKNLSLSPFKIVIDRIYVTGVLPIVLSMCEALSSTSGEEYKLGVKEQIASENIWA
jgi:hypothetical protein